MSDACVCMHKASLEACDSTISSAAKYKYLRQSSGASKACSDLIIFVALELSPAANVVQPALTG